MLLNMATHLMSPSPRMKILAVILIAILLMAGYFVVHLTGGTHLSYLHFFYIPIILAGFIFSVRGGIITGIIAGLLIGPFLMDNVEYEVAQTYSSWMNRLFFFALIGMGAGFGSSIFRSYLKELERKHTADPITDLPNINGLKKLFEPLALHKSKPIVIAVIDLRHMGRIDRGLGVEGTSELLRQVGKTLSEELKGKAIIGHLHTKRFALIIPDEKNVKDVLEICAHLSDHTFTVENIPLFIEMEMGISVFPQNDTCLSSLIRKAQMATSPLTLQGNFSYFEEKNDENAEHNLLLLHQLRKAIENEDLVLFYQPKFSVKDGSIMGVEALVRWTDPILGFVSPMDFIPLTEDTLLIHPFTKWLVKKSLNDLKKIHKDGYPISMAINFSMKNFQDSSVIQLLEKEVDLSKLAPHFLEIEVTETSVSTNIKQVSQVLAALREKGIHIAVDDFGTGQSSQQYLFELPLDTIKIDRVFISAMTHSPIAKAIVKSAISLGHDLNLTVVGEGVETEEELALLKNLDCDLAQGFLLAKPMPLGDLLRLLENQSKQNFKIFP